MCFLTGKQVKALLGSLPLTQRPPDTPDLWLADLLTQKVTQEPFPTVPTRGSCSPPPPPPCPTTALSKHGDPVFAHFCPLNQNLAYVRTEGGGYATKAVVFPTPPDRVHWCILDAGGCILIFVHCFMMDMAVQTFCFSHFFH